MSTTYDQVAILIVISDVVTAHSVVKQFTGISHCLIQQLKWDFTHIKVSINCVVSCHFSQCLWYLFPTDKLKTCFWSPPYDMAVTIHLYQQARPFFIKLELASSKRSVQKRYEQAYLKKQTCIVTHA